MAFDWQPLSLESDNSGFITAAPDFLFGLDGELYMVDTFSLFRYVDDDVGWHEMTSWASWNVSAVPAMAETADHLWIGGALQKDTALSTVHNGIFAIRKSDGVVEFPFDPISPFHMGPFSPLDDPRYSRPSQMKADGDNTLYIWGQFTLVNEGTGPVACFNVARYDVALDTVHPLAGGLLAPEPNSQTVEDFRNIPSRIVIASTGVYFAGKFDFVPDLGFGCQCIARWDGVGWNKVGPPTDPGVRAVGIGAAQITGLCLHENGDDVVAAGNFNVAGGVAADHVAVYRALTNTWEPFGQGFEGAVPDVGNFQVTHFGGTYYLLGPFELLDPEQQGTPSRPAVWALRDPSEPWRLIGVSSVVGLSATAFPGEGGLRAGRAARHVHKGSHALLVGMATVTQGASLSIPAFRMRRPTSTSEEPTSRIWRYQAEQAPWLRQKQRDDVLRAVARGPNAPTSRQRGQRAGTKNTYH